MNFAPPPPLSPTAARDDRSLPVAFNPRLAIFAIVFFYLNDANGISVSR
jgi:hypothetical protein